MVCVLSVQIVNVADYKAAGEVAWLYSVDWLARQFNDQVQRELTPNEFVRLRGCAHAAANAASYIRNSNELNAIYAAHDYWKSIENK